jgi:chromate reductase
MFTPNPPATGGASGRKQVMAFKIGYFVGSLSSHSINRTLSKALIRLAPAELEFTEIPIKDLPLYSPDFDAAFPPEAQALKDAIAASDGILFVSPEYNRSIPGALKNAIDWGSRPGAPIPSPASPPGSSAPPPAASARQ